VTVNLTVDLPALRARVREYTGLLSTELVPDATINAYLGEVFDEVLDAEEWPFLEDTVAVGFEARDPRVWVGAVGRILSVTVAGTRPRLLTRRAGTAAAAGAGFTLIGHPLEYSAEILSTSRGMTRLTLYPTPVEAGSLELRVRRAPKPLAETTWMPFDSRFVPVLAYGAAVRLLTREADDSGRIAAYQGEYLSLLKRMRDFYLPSFDRATLVLGGRADKRRRRGWSA
jgi:hypothetical protein